MTRFHSEEFLDVPFDQVVRWHSLPGALTRLSPHWAQEVVEEGDPGRPGSRARLRISTPGTSGAVRIPWTAEHFALEGLPPFGTTAEAADRTETAGAASGSGEATTAAETIAGFGDRLVPGALSPFSRLEHRHVFRSAEGGTRIDDTLDYSLRGAGAPHAEDAAAAGDSGAAEPPADVPRTYGPHADRPWTAGGERTARDDRESRRHRAAQGFDRFAEEFGRFASRIPGVSQAAQAVGVDDRIRTTLEQTFAARTHRIRSDLAFLDQLDAPTTGGERILNVLVTGASGLVGTQLTAMLTTAGHRVRTLVRRKPRPGLGRDDGTSASAFDTRLRTESPWDPTLGLLNAEDLAWADVVVHLAGRSIGGRLTPAAKAEIESSRIDSTRLLVDTIADLPAEQRPEAFVCASAVGYYGTDVRAPVTEEAGPGSGFLAEVCRRWEAEAARVEAAGVRRVSVRTGLVMSGLGGLLRLQLPLYLAAAGGPLGSGEQWFPWISHDDLVRVYARAVADSALSGPVNAVAPGAVTQKEFAAALGHHLHRPAVLSVPRVGPALLLGDEGADELALAGQHVVPTVLDAVGHEFAHPTLEDCFTEELGPRS